MAAKRQTLFLLPIVSIVLSGLYLFGLHPTSGNAGGILFLLIGWLVPSLIPVLIASWVAFLWAKHPISRSALFLLVLFLASTNTRLPDLLSQITTPTKSDWHVERQIEKADSYDLVDLTKENTLALVRPALPRVRWNGSERCMCLYLDLNRTALFESGMTDLLGKRAVIPSSTGRPPYFSYDLLPEPSGQRSTAVLTLHDQHGEAATFRQQHIPTIFAFPDLGGDGMQGVDIATHGLDLLLHDNIILLQLSSWLPSLFDQPAFTAFLEAATQPPPR